MKKQNKFKELLIDKPDIVIIITDQERATQYFPEGWERENLPTLTKLKDNGFTFERPFVIVVCVRRVEPLYLLVRTHHNINVLKH